MLRPGPLDVAFAPMLDAKIGGSGRDPTPGPVAHPGDGLVRGVGVRVIITFRPTRGQPAMPNMKIIGSLAAASAAVATAAVVKKKAGERTTEDEKGKKAKTKDAKAKDNSGGRRWLGLCRCSK